MAMMESIKKWTWLLLLMVCQVGALAQSRTTEGTDFWFGFMQNREKPNTGDYAILEVYISARNGASGRLEMPSLPDYDPIDFTVGAGGSVTLTVRDGFPGFGAPDPMPKFSSYQRTAIHITADDTISVFAINKVEFSADAAVIFPTPSLGKEYYVLTHWEDGFDGLIPNNLESELLIVGVEDSTEIELYRSVNTTDGGCHYEAERIFLDRGDAYQLQARGENTFCGGPTSGDLSGTRIVSVGGESACKPFAVFAGAISTQVTATGEAGCADGAADHLFEQMQPVSTWGKTFVVLPFETRSRSYFKAVAAEADTRIRVFGENGLAVFDEVLAQGEVKAFAWEGDQPAKIAADKAISVLQLSRSAWCDSTDSDPFSLVISPLEQRLRQVTFNVFSGTPTSGFTYYLNIVVPSADVGSTRLDGIVLASSLFRPVPADTAYSFARIANISEGTHRLASPGGFISTVYGYGRIESYGYATGTNLVPAGLSLSLTNSLTGQVLTLDELCLGAEIVLRASSENPAIDRFIWDFGDGSMPIEGQEVTHRFDRAGQWRVTVKGLDSDGGACQTGEVFEIEVDLRPEALAGDDALVGARFLCPGMQGVEYTVTESSYPSYQWLVSGGDIAGQTTNSITVDWGGETKDAHVEVFGVTANGCYTDTMKLAVAIADGQILDLPITGDTLICPDAWGDRLYRIDAPKTNATTTWEWVVQGGIVTDQPSAQTAIIDWDPEASGHYLTVIQQELGTAICLFPASDTVYLDVRKSLADRLVLEEVSWPQAGQQDSEIRLVYDRQSAEIDPNITIQRRQIHPTLAATATTIGSSSTGQFTDSDVAPQSQYAYQLAAKSTCDGRIFELEEVRSVLLVSSLEDPEIALSWTDFTPFAAPEYRIWQQVDDGTYELGPNVTSPGTMRLPRPEEASEVCYKIEVVDPTGEEGRTVWSNQSCIQFGDRPYIPPIITPNGDGINDVFAIRQSYLLSSYDLIIFNRWGQQMLRANSESPWIWTPKVAGTYYYIIEGMDRKGQPLQVSGAVTVVF